MAADIQMPRVKPDFEGYLYKRSELAGLPSLACPLLRLQRSPMIFSLHNAGTWIKEWRRRYFRLIGNKLYFSKEQQVGHCPLRCRLGYLRLYILFTVCPATVCRTSPTASST
jgi:hypothetical protein